MRNKLYFVAQPGEQVAISAACAVGPREWHFHTIPPAHESLLVVVMNPTLPMEEEFSKRYLAFPATTGLSTQDSTFSALKKIHAAHGMAGMHPKS
jgi:hypothetical protein